MRYVPMDLAGAGARKYEGIGVAERLQVPAELADGRYAGTMGAWVFAVPELRPATDQLTGQRSACRMQGGVPVEIVEVERSRLIAISGCLLGCHHLRDEWRKRACVIRVHDNPAHCTGIVARSNAHSLMRSRSVVR